MSVKRLVVHVSVPEPLLGTVLSRCCSGPGGHRGFTCSLSHDLLDEISCPQPSQSLPSFKIQSDVGNSLEPTDLSPRGGEDILAVGSSNLPLVFSKTFVSCPNGREEVGPAVHSPGAVSCRADGAMKGIGQL